MHFFKELDKKRIIGDLEFLDLLSLTDLTPREKEIIDQFKDNPSEFGWENAMIAIIGDCPFSFEEMLADKPKFFSFGSLACN